MATPPLHPKDPNSSNCDKISSNCVIWQGADIPCLNLCTGDTIDIVVSKLAVIVCEVSKLIDLDYSCLLELGEPSPETITEIAELLITNICDLSGSTRELRDKVNELIVIIENPDNPLNPIIPLPPDLYYYDSNGDLITQLPLTDYVYYLASKLVDVIAFNEYYKQQQELINAKFDSLAARVLILESTAAVPPTITIISQGVSYYIPGTVIPIAEGFWNFERAYVGFSGTVGSTADLTTAIAKQTPNLANLPQLLNPSLFMKSIAGWNSSPLTLADSFGNLWLTVTDLRAKVQALINATPVVPCILIPMETQAVTAITTFYATFEFTPSALTTIEPPIGYLIEVFNVADTTFTTPLVTITTSNVAPVTISNAAILVGVDYVVSTKVLYNCGESVRKLTTTKLLVATITFVIGHSILAGTSTPGLVCTGTDGIPTTYTQNTSNLLIQLRNKATNALVTVTGAPINVVVRMKIESCYNTGLQTSYQEVTVTIPIGSTGASYIYVSDTMMPCSDGLCDYINTYFNCGVSIDNINTEFSSSTTVCTTP